MLGWLTGQQYGCHPGSARCCRGCWCSPVSAGFAWCGWLLPLCMAAGWTRSVPCCASACALLTLPSLSGRLPPPCPSPPVPSHMQGVPGVYIANQLSEYEEGGVSHSHRGIARSWPLLTYSGCPCFDSVPSILRATSRHDADPVFTSPTPTLLSRAPSPLFSLSTLPLPSSPLFPGA